MPKRPSWLSSREAAALLDVKLQTLYAYTSRGLVESVPGPRGRGRRYARESIERLKMRHDARAGHAAVAAGALRFGEPSIETSISDIRSDGPWYRGHSALELCERNVGFEAVFDLLLTGELTPLARWPDEQVPSTLRELRLPASAQYGTPSSLLAAWLGIAALTDEARHGASEREEHERARRLTLWLADKLAELLPAPAASLRRSNQQAGMTPAPAETAARSAARQGGFTPAPAKGRHSSQQSGSIPAPAETAARSAARQGASTPAPAEEGGRRSGRPGGLVPAPAAESTRRSGRPGELVPMPAKSMRRSERQMRARSPRLQDGSREPATVAERVLVALGGTLDPAHVELIDRTLILCADHELNASTFVARVAASTGADLYACLAAALHALSGALHGGASARVEALLREVDSPARVASVLRERQVRGEIVPGFGQPLYPNGDPRGRVMFELAEAVLGRSRRRQYECLVAVRDAMARASHPGPNLDAGLVAVCSALELPHGSAAALFAIGRIPGWVAHSLEQRAQHYILRPRARYVTPPTKS